MPVPYILFASVCKIVYCSDCLLRPSPRYTANTTCGKVVFSVRCVHLSVHQAFLPTRSFPWSLCTGPGLPLYQALALSIDMFKLAQLGPQLDPPPQHVHMRARTVGKRAVGNLLEYFVYFLVHSIFIILVKNIH